VIRIPSELEDQKIRVAEAYAKVLGARTVVRDLSGIHGEYRRPEVEVLYGSDTRTVHREGGILYTMDVTKVMFASGNIDERERMGTIDCRGEVVVDMFAGIGYFTLPIAKKAGAKRVIACEKNPQSHAFLVENIRLNGVEDRVQTFLGDNRELPGEGFADRVVMGYVGTTRSFLPKGMSLCRSGGMIHFHDTYNVRDLPQGPISDIERAAKGRGFEVLQVREVKSYAPSVSHVVVDLRLD
jgi:tRNA wybutosine-synthesizing protein 2